MVKFLLFWGIENDVMAVDLKIFASFGTSAF
jgi:hypothetical protein